MVPDPVAWLYSVSHSKFTLQTSQLPSCPFGVSYQYNFDLPLFAHHVLTPPPSFLSSRMYITNKQTQQVKLPPPMPATADFLLRTRPGHQIIAPTYDSLCQQIRDVQRQYTCGTTKERPKAMFANGGGRPPRAVGSNADVYISGLDGPSLDEIVMQQDLPIGLVRLALCMLQLTVLLCMQQTCKYCLRYFNPCQIVKGGLGARLRVHGSDMQSWLGYAIQFVCLTAAGSSVEKM